jgi:hypothetical protein
VKRPIGRFSTKTDRHDTEAISAPPTSGPIADATPVSPDQAPMARARSSGRIVAWTMARLPGVRSAAPTPCTTRAAISSVVPGATAHRSEAAQNTTAPISYTFRRP